MEKRLIAALFALLIAFSAAGCADAGTGSDETTVAPDALTTAVQEATEPMLKAIDLGVTMFTCNDPEKAIKIFREIGAR